MKGALTENINRLEKLMNNGTSKYMRERKRKCIVHFLSLYMQFKMFNERILKYEIESENNESWYNDKRLTYYFVILRGA